MESNKHLNCIENLIQSESLNLKTSSTESKDLGSY